MSKVINIIIMFKLTLQTINNPILLIIFFQMMHLYWGVKKGYKLCNYSSYVNFVMRKFLKGEFETLKPMLQKCKKERGVDEATWLNVLAHYERTRACHYTRCFDIKDLSYITAAYIKKIWGKSNITMIEEMIFFIINSFIH